MPIKFFQKVVISDGKSKDVDILKVGDTILSISFKNGFAQQVETTVEKESAIFPKQSWNGYKISWKSGSFYGTKNQSVLLSNHEIIPIKELVAGKHELLDKNFNSITIDKIEFGKVLCGRKKVYLKSNNTADSKSEHLLNVSGIWVGDTTLELEELKKSKEQENKAYIFPGNPIIRGFRLLMMSVMGKKEES